MFCTKCGQSAPDQTRFCGRCGAHLPSDASKENSRESLPLWRSIPGFRSKTPWKMILASVVYFFILLVFLLPAKNKEVSKNDSPKVLYEQIEALVRNESYPMAQNVIDELMKKHPQSEEAAKIKELKWTNLDWLIKQRQAEKAKITENTSAPVVTTQAPVADISFETIHVIKNKRFDKGVNIYVLVDPKNYALEESQQQIKSIINRIVSQNGKKTSIDFFDEKDALELHYQKWVTLQYKPTATENNLIVDHHVAGFSGDLSTAPYLNTLYFYPGKSARAISYTPE